LMAFGLIQAKRSGFASEEGDRIAQSAVIGGEDVNVIKVSDDEPILAECGR